MYGHTACVLQPYSLLLSIRDLFPVVWLSQYELKIISHAGRRIMISRRMSWTSYACMVMHTLVAIHCSIRRSSWVMHCFRPHFRTTPHDPRKQRDTASAHQAYRFPCCLMKLVACCFLEWQVSHCYRWQVNNPHLFQDCNATA